MGNTQNTYFNGKKFIDIDSEIRAETLENSIELVNKVCPICKAMGRWNRDEDNDNIIMCECGFEQILDEEKEARALDKVDLDDIDGSLQERFSN